SEAHCWRKTRTPESGVLSLDSNPATMTSSSSDGLWRRSISSQPLPIFQLQALPGVGPALAHRLLCHFGSIERIVTSDATTLAEVRGRSRELVTDSAKPKCLVG